MFYELAKTLQGRKVCGEETVKMQPCDPSAPPTLIPTLWSNVDKIAHNSHWVNVPTGEIFDTHPIVLDYAEFTRVD